MNKSKIKRIAVIGPDAYPAVPVGGGSAQAVPFASVSLLQGISSYLGANASVTYASAVMSLARAALSTDFQTNETGGSGLKVENFNNEDLSGQPGTGASQHINLGIPFDLSSINFDEIDFSSLMTNGGSSERWTGYYVPKTAGTFDVFVQQGGFSPSGFRMYLDGKLLFDNWDNQKFIVAQASAALDATPHKIVFEHHTGLGFGPPFVRMGIVPQGAWVDPAAEQLAANADMVVLALGFNPLTETEGWDRTFELPPGQNELIQKIAAKNKNTILVITSGGGVDMVSWIEKVPAIVEAWYPGQEGGTALAERGTAHAAP